MDLAIKATGVKRSFPIRGGQPFWALKGVDIDVPRGCLTILKGKSGSGKTTLLNLLSMLDRPDEGQILFDGQDIAVFNEAERTRIRRRSIGFVFQSVALIPMMNAYENVEFALRLARSADDRRTRVTECLTMVGLHQRMNHMPHEMSGGEQQRVAIARALAHRPSVVFADEPTAELDTDTGLRVVKIFKELIAVQGTTVVMTTHDAGLMELSDSTYELADGEILYGS